MKLKMLKKNYKSARKRYLKRKKYSKSLALYEAFNVFREKKRPKNMREAMRRYDLIISAIRKQIPETLKKYSSSEWVEGTPSEQPAPIWLCWLDGPEKVPSFCRRCISMIRLYAGNHPIKFIDVYNLGKYIPFPEYVTELAGRGKMSLATFCDVIRLSLLYEHGGLWLDTDQLVTKNIPDELFSKPFVSTHNDYSDIPFEEAYKYIAQGNWTAQVLGSWKGNTLVKFVYDAFVEYCSKNDEMIEYLIVDYFIEIARRSFPAAAKYIEGHFPNGNYRKLHQAMKAGEPAAGFSAVIPKETVFNNLNWKIDYPSKATCGIETLYDVFLKIPEADDAFLKSCR